MLTPLLQPNLKLLESFENHAEKTLQKHFTSETYAKRLTAFIINDLEGSAPSIKNVANHMATSVRNLQLKLEKEGTTYTKLLKKIRIDIAKEYLKENHVSMPEISYLLGFSDPSAFHHFFKKITGYTPLIYREKYRE